jgi:hypothetical protein
VLSLPLKSKRLGWPPIPQSVYDKATQMRLEGASFRKSGKKLGIDEGTIRKKK